VEGSSFNKYIEIYNPTGASIALTGLALRVYANGSLTPGPAINLTGTLAPRAVYIVANPMATLTGVTPNLSTGSLNFNGNDAVVLEGPSGQLDIVGTIGDTSNFALDVTFVRNAGIVSGHTSGGWSPSEWTMLGTDMHRLGSHTP
jgi:predicted extracellular nuclease